MTQLWTIYGIIVLLFAMIQISSCVYLGRIYEILRRMEWKLDHNKKNSGRRNGTQQSAEWNTAVLRIAARKEKNVSNI